MSELSFRWSGNRTLPIDEKVGPPQVDVWETCSDPWSWRRIAGGGHPFYVVDCCPVQNKAIEPKNDILKKGLGRTKLQKDYPVGRRSSDRRKDTVTIP